MNLPDNTQPGLNRRGVNVPKLGGYSASQGEKLIRALVESGLALSPSRKNLIIRAHNFSLPTRSEIDLGRENEKQDSGP